MLNSTEKFQGYNLIMVYNKDRTKLLFCKRKKDPYQGLYNFVGGKIDEGEDGFQAAYRELFEETGLGRDDIELYHMMNFLYHNQQCYVEVYAGVLREDGIRLVEEKNPLIWFNEDQDFFDCKRFAGEGNIGHMVEQVRRYGMGSQRQRGICLGVDSCKDGWVVGYIEDKNFIVEKYNTIQEVVTRYHNFEELFIDMAVGLPESSRDIRPDSFARRLIQGRATAIFAVPCRQAVYMDTEEEMIEENIACLGKGLGRQITAIIPKMREIDEFIQSYPEFKSLLKESSPEVCYARLLGETVMTSKTKLEGLVERVEILKPYIDGFSIELVKTAAEKLQCHPANIIDAACLAVTANMAALGEVEVIPERPMKDKRGIPMRMMIPKMNQD